MHNPAAWDDLVNMHLNITTITKGSVGPVQAACIKHDLPLTEGFQTSSPVKPFLSWTASTTKTLGIFSEQSEARMENGAPANEGKDPSGFLSQIIGNPVTVKLNSGVVYKGE